MEVTLRTCVTQVWFVHVNGCLYSGMYLYIANQGADPKEYYAAT